VNSATLAYTLPFAVFLALLALNQVLPIPVWVRFVLPIAAIAAVSRVVLKQDRLRKALESILLGLVVFAIWVGPDFLVPGWHTHWLFSNFIMGHPSGSTPPADQHSLAFLIWRILVSVVAVPILEELFWRGWLMRWLIDQPFTKVPLGTYAPQAFWIVAVLFASEHGSYWDVGLVTGVIYNWWMVRTKSLWSCILMHSVTNGALAWYVISQGKWQYWL
jgi:CAAX prenyl protease-like protein